MWKHSSQATRVHLISKTLNQHKQFHLLRALHNQSLFLGDKNYVILFLLWLRWIHVFIKISKYLLRRQGRMFDSLFRLIKSTWVNTVYVLSKVCFCKLLPHHNFSICCEKQESYVKELTPSVHSYLIKYNVNWRRN